MLKFCVRKAVLVLVCFSCVACQSTPKTKPLTEMSDEEKKAVYMYGPVGDAPKEKSHVKKALTTTGAVLLILPFVLLIGYVTNAAAEGKQVHVGK